MSWRIFDQDKPSATKTKLLRLASVTLFGLSFVVVYALHVAQVGVSMESNNGRVVVSAGSNPVILVWDAMAIVLYVTLMLRKANSVIVGVPTRARRIAAFLIDFWFSILALSGVTALMPLCLEAARTRHFTWHFQRSYTVNTDQMVFPSVLLFMALMFLYFAFLLTRGRQTVGCFIMRLKTTPPYGDGGCFTFRAAIIRTFYEFRGLSSFLTRKWDRDSEGRTWYDIQTNCKVVLLEDN